jgi:hypothetical protein
MGERVAMVRGPFDVRIGRRSFFGFEGEKVDEGRLRAFKLRCHRRLLAHEGVDEPIE